MERTVTPHIRLVLADSQPIYCLGMKNVLAQEGNIRVVAHVETVCSLYAALERCPADVVVIEARLISGEPNPISELMRRSPNTKLIVHMTEAEEAGTVELYRHGVRGVVRRSIAPDLLLKCVRKIVDGETWIDNSSICRVIDAYRSRASTSMDSHLQPKLSSKELSIIRCVTGAMRNKEIAYEIGTTEQVIKNSLRKIYEKLGVSDRLELALYCLHHEVLNSDAHGRNHEARAWTSAEA